MHGSLVSNRVGQVGFCDKAGHQEEARQTTRDFLKRANADLWSAKRIV